ncbi:hypothetical protein LCGC14_0972620 [marine sediment metagenome]|uniref:Uncharacterized protein n=1 Tax=marine sediment metagenome TaxID=412755 RepID=A0A0F9NXF7_9ZZZZ
MAAVIGTNSGFCASSPSGDPAGAEAPIDGNARAQKDTSPAGNNVIIEMGFYTGQATEESDFEVGIYEHNAGDDNPEALVGKSAATAKGTSAGWKKVTGLSIPISAATAYWVAVQLDDTATQTKIDYSLDAGEKADDKTVQTTLTDPWGVSGGSDGIIAAVYAVYEAVAAAVTIKAGIIREESLNADNEIGIF